MGGEMSLWRIAIHAGATGQHTLTNISLRISVQLILNANNQPNHMAENQCI